MQFSYLIFWGGVMSFLTIRVRVWWFTCCQEWGILNPSISSLELSWYRFHLKPSPKECCYLWCLSMIQVFSYPLGKSTFHLFVDLKQAFVFGSGRISPHNFWDVIHKSTTSLFFRSWFSQQLRSTLPSKFFSFNSFNSFRRFCVMSSSSIIPSSLARVLFHPCFSRSAA